MLQLNQLVEKTYKKFLMPGEQSYETFGILPNSSYYLIHPILDNSIRKFNKNYESNINTINAVGYDRYWNIEKKAQ